MLLLIDRDTDIVIARDVFKNADRGSKEMRDANQKDILYTTKKTIRL